MFKLRDFFPIPQVSGLVKQVLASGAGLTVVTGYDHHPVVTTTKISHELLPSGRGAIFRALMDEMFAANEKAKIFIVTEDKTFFPVSRRDERRIGRLIVEEPLSYEQRILEAIKRSPKVLVVDHIFPSMLPVVLEAVEHGIQVFSQADTILRGASATRWLFREQTMYDQPTGISWVLSVHRIPTLCPICRKETRPTAAQLEMLRYLITRMGDTNFADIATRPFYQASKCDQCNQTGRQGDSGIQ